MKEPLPTRCCPKMSANSSWRWMWMICRGWSLEHNQLLGQWNSAITIKDKIIMNEGWSLPGALFMLEHEGKGFRKKLS